MYLRNSVVFVSSLSFVMFFFRQKEVVAGLNVGCFFCIVNFVLLKVTVRKKTILLGKNSSKVLRLFFAFFCVLLRYSVMSFPLLLSIKFERFGIAGSIVGLLSIQIVILFDLLFVIITKKIVN